LGFWDSEICLSRYFALYVLPYATAMIREQETCIPGGEMVLSKTEGIVISITGLLDEMPPAASLYARSISSMLERKQNFHIRDYFSSQINSFSHNHMRGQII
jgi:hypothetical protein